VGSHIEKEQERHNIKYNINNRKKKKSTEVGCGGYVFGIIFSVLIPIFGLIVFVAYIDKDINFAKTNGIIGLISSIFWALLLIS